MSKYYIGVDIGSISTKAVVIDEKNNIIADEYIWTEGNPIIATKQIITSLRDTLTKNKIEYNSIYGVGTTGSARNLIGKVIGANVIKNEITAHAIGTLSIYPNVKTIIEIGGQDSKIIIVRDGIVVDYAMNTLCAAGTGAFLSSQAKRLGVEIEDLGKIAKSSTNPSKIAARCTVFAESDLVHKAQIGHKKEDIIAGVCNAVANNYLNNLAKGKKIEDEIVFQGGVSKNEGVVESFKNILNKEIHVDANSHLMGALGIAILSKENKISKEDKKNEESKLDFNFDIKNVDFKTIGKECIGCNNNCEIIDVYKDNEILCKIGGRCEKGSMML